MGSKLPCENLSLNELKLTKASIELLKEEVKGGVLKVQYRAQFQVAKNGKVDENNPGRVLLTISVEGLQRKDAENETDQDKAFIIEATIVGTFRATDGAVFSLAQFSDCYDWAAMQTYLPLREYVSYTLSQMGLRLPMPLVLPPRHEIADTPSSAT